MRISSLIRPIGVAALLSLCMATACKKEEKPTVAAPAPSVSADPLADMKAFLEDDTATLTKPIYKKLLLQLSTCKLTERGINPKCKAYEDVRRVRGRKGSPREMAEMNAALGKELITNEHPAVRLQAAKLMQSVFGTNKESQKLLIAAAKKEKEPAVLAAMLRTVGSRHRASPEIKELLLKMADNKSEVVRREAMSWFLTSFGEGVEGTFEKVLEKVDKDPSIEVRAYLCNRLYGSSDERALEVFKKYLEADDTPKKLYNACWNGVINSWTGFPKPRKPSQAGYELTMKILERTPRTKDRPSWSGISTLRSAKTEYRESDRYGQAWLEAVKPWYRPARLLAALKNIANDENANWMARTASLRVMRELGEKKATFTLLLQKYKEAKAGDDFHVKRQIEEILRKLEGGVGPSGSARPGPHAIPGGPGHPTHRPISASPPPGTPPAAPPRPAPPAPASPPTAPAAP